MYTGGRQAEHHIAGCDAGAWQKLATLGGADAEACKVIIRPVVEAGHLGGLAADEGAARDAAARRDPADDIGADTRHQLAGGVIVEEEQRLGALDDDVVHAHRHEIDADRVVAAGLDGDLDLGADAVIGRHQDRVGEAGGLQVEQPAEPADLGIRPGPAGGAHQRLDRLDHGVARIDIDARIRVGHSVPAFAVLALGRHRHLVSTSCPGCSNGSQRSRRVVAHEFGTWCRARKHISIAFTVRRAPHRARRSRARFDESDRQRPAQIGASSSGGAKLRQKNG